MNRHFFLKYFSSRMRHQGRGPAGNVWARKEALEQPEFLPDLQSSPSPAFIDQQVNDQEDDEVNDQGNDQEDLLRLALLRPAPYRHPRRSNPRRDAATFVTRAEGRRQRK
jgi:hypothetical protein